MWPSIVTWRASRREPIAAVRPLRRCARWFIIEQIEAPTVRGADMLFSAGNRSRP